MLFSYPLASGFANQSDQNDMAALPSPYQLELIIRLLDGRITAVWSYLQYVLHRKHKRVQSVKVLTQAAALMGSILALS